jgi:predicted aspartyl protease
MGMGTFRVACQIDNPVRRTKSAKVPGLLVDTGSECTWVSEQILKDIGIKPEKKDVPFVMANGNTVTRNIGFAILRIGEHFTIDEVVFAQEGDLCLLGARTLEGMNLRVDARGKKLVAAGPVPAAYNRSGLIDSPSGEP